MVDKYHSCLQLRGVELGGDEEGGEEEKRRSGGVVSEKERERVEGKLK